MSEDPKTAGPQPSVSAATPIVNADSPQVLKQPDSSPAAVAKPKKARKPRPPRIPKANQPGGGKGSHWYLTAKPSEKHGPMGHFHHLTADEAGPGLRSGTLVEPTADQLKQRVDGPAE